MSTGAVSSANAAISLIGVIDRAAVFGQVSECAQRARAKRRTLDDPLQTPTLLGNGHSEESIGLLPSDVNLSAQFGTYDSSDMSSTDSSSVKVNRNHTNARARD